jgi:hypothetical protein
MIASAVLQLALYRSGRRDRASSIAIPDIYGEFARLRTCMHGLARKCNSQRLEIDCTNNIGFKEKSTAKENGEHEYE